MSVGTVIIASPHDLSRAYRQARTGTGPRLLRAQPSTDKVAEFARAVVEGLSAEPRQLPCRYLYDTRGSQLFERITEQPEYYPTRTEAQILERCAKYIADATGKVTLFELGAGSARKTGHLLAAYRKLYGDVSYVPVDVSASALREAAEWVSTEHPSTRVVAINSTYERSFPLLEAAAPAMGVFLGSTVGNFFPHEFERFWRSVADSLPVGSYFLLGVDLVKSKAVLDAAYDDAAGVTAEFTKNLFVRMNRELETGLDLEHIDHVARYQPEREQVEIHARFTTSQKLRIGPLAYEFSIRAGEEVLVEISRKFRLETLLPELAQLGFATRASCLDDPRRFAVLLLQRT
jgi:L-histidine N-alpha-methyltransferase